jgi:hypothetical protein
MKIFIDGKTDHVILSDEIGVGTDEGKLLFTIRICNEAMDVAVAGDNILDHNFGMLAITPISSRRLTVRRDRRDNHSR